MGVSGRDSQFFEEKGSLKEFFNFIRLKVCIFVVSVALTGYLFFNPIDEKIFYVILTVFSASAAGYSLNQITDKKEDLLNNKKINYFASSQYGKKIVMLFFFLGAFFSLLLSPIVRLIFFLLIFLIVAYSIARIKEIFLLKNLYTAFVLSSCFLIGASANGLINFSMIMNYFLVSIFVFAASLVSDLRDYGGDKSTGIRTLPVVFGYEKGKGVVYFSLVVFSIFTIGFGFNGFYLILPFLLPIFFFLNKNRPSTAHLLLLLSFIFLSFALLAIKSGWWLFAL